MLKFYIKTALRNYRSKPLIFAGSIVTVFLSVLCISLLFTSLHNELTMNNFHKRRKDIYMLTIQQSPESQIEMIEAELFFDFNYKDFPEIENFATIKKYKTGELQFSRNETILTPEGIVADSTFFEIFDFKLRTGDKFTALDEPESIILTERFARQLFGEENPLGKAIKITSRREKFYTVKALAETPPPNSSITFDFIIPNHSKGYSRSGCNFILVNNNFDKNAFVAKIKNLGQKHEQFQNSTMDVMAFNNVYFYGGSADFKGVFSTFGNRKNVNILFVIIGIVYVVTLLNFSNLQILSINSSIKNIGIKKIIGAGQKHIFYQKITELIIMMFLSAGLTTGAFYVLLPFFNKITSVELAPETWKILLLNCLILLFLISFSMIYPSLVFLRISITNSLKNQIF